MALGTGRRELPASGCGNPHLPPSFQPFLVSACVICSPKSAFPREVTFRLIQKRTEEGLRNQPSGISGLSLSLALGSSSATCSRGWERGRPLGILALIWACPTARASAGSLHLMAKEVLPYRYMPEALKPPRAIKVGLI